MKFRRNLGMLEALGLSLSIIAPTIAMSFVTTLAVQAAGPAAPLAFLIGMVAVAIVWIVVCCFRKRGFAALDRLTPTLGIPSVRAGGSWLDGLFC